jgi:hypothetical protein
MVREGLKADASRWIVPMLGLEEPSEPERDQVLDIPPQAELSAQAHGEAHNHLAVLDDQLLTGHGHLLNAWALAKWVNEVK